MATTFHALDTDRLEGLSDLPAELALRRSVPLLAHLARDPAFLDAYVLPLLPEAGAREDWYVAHTFDGQDGSYSLQVFAWPAGTGTQIHDHTSWGAYCCVAGSVLEERYERLDDGSKPEYAHLKKAWQLSWGREDGVSTVLPYEEGIHRVGNPGGKTASSVHLCGPQKGDLDGRDYDVPRLRVRPVGGLTRPEAPRREAYSPKLVEGSFPEVRMQHPQNGSGAPTRISRPRDSSR